VTEQPHYIDPNNPHNPSATNSSTELPKNLFEICQNFPFGNIVADERTRDLLFGYLPSEESEANLFVERFFLNIGWLYNIVPKKRLTDMIKVLYDPTMPPHALGMGIGGMSGVGDNSQNAQGASALSSHRMAIIYMVFALNTLVDQQPRPGWHSTNTYSELARAALGMDTIFGTNATLATVQALALLSLWYQLSDDSGGFIHPFARSLTLTKQLHYYSGDPSKSWGCLGLTFKVNYFFLYTASVHHRLNFTTLFRLRKVLDFIVMAKTGRLAKKKRWTDDECSGNYNRSMLGKLWGMDDLLHSSNLISIVRNLSIPKRAWDILLISIDGSIITLQKALWPFSSRL
jgi:hypothetical protein